MWWDQTGEAAVAICIISSNGQNALLPERHVEHSVVPAFDHLAHPDGNLELASVFGRVKLRSHAVVRCNIGIVKASPVVDYHLIAFGGSINAVSGLEDDFRHAHDQIGWSKIVVSGMVVLVGDDNVHSKLTGRSDKGLQNELIVASVAKK